MLFKAARKHYWQLRGITLTMSRLARLIVSTLLRIVGQNETYTLLLLESDGLERIKQIAIKCKIVIKKKNYTGDKNKMAASCVTLLFANIPPNKNNKIHPNLHSRTLSLSLSHTHSPFFVVERQSSSQRMYLRCLNAWKKHTNTLVT